MNRVLSSTAAVWVVLATIVSIAAQSPVVNAVVDRRPSSGDFIRDVQSIAGRGTQSWIGYRVPIVRRADAPLDSNGGCCGRCRLAPPTDLVVLARVQEGSVVELRSLAVDCDVDAGGMPLVWFDAVSADARVAWLGALATSPPAGSRRIADNAVAALGQDAAAPAAAMLVRLAQSGSAQSRGQAMSWLARRAAAEALPTIDTTLKQDPDSEVKKQAVQALSRFPNHEGIPKLMDVARTHPDMELRRQAMLLLGQSKDPRAIDFLTQILLK